MSLLYPHFKLLAWGQATPHGSDDKDLELLKPATNGGEYLERLMNRGAVGLPKFSRFVERIFFMLEPIEWDSNPGEEAYKNVVVPTGFVTDLASIPPVLWPILPSDGPYAYAAIIHDYLYWAQPVPREDADQIFKFVMEDFRISSMKIAALYDGVRLGGASAWDNNQKLKKAGESRILREIPKTPVTRWEDWKRDPKHFVH